MYHEPCTFSLLIHTNNNNNNLPNVTVSSDEHLIKTVDDRPLYIS